MIRQIDKTDLDMISNLRYNMFKEKGMAHLLADNFILKTIAWYHDMYEAGRCTHLVKEVSGNIVGCAGVLLQGTTAPAATGAGTYGHIFDIFVEKSHREQQIAGDLVKELVTWLRRKQILTVKLAGIRRTSLLYKQLGLAHATGTTFRLSSQPAANCPAKKAITTSVFFDENLMS